MSIQQRLLTFIVRSNWILLVLAAAVGYFTASSSVTLGIIAGGLIVTINFHLLYRTLKKSLAPPHLASPNVVLVKYYIRFIISGLIILLLIAGDYVNPLGLFIGLSVVVASIMLATLCEVKNNIFKEAV
ncbi:MAG: ATP synthase subunit I [Desulfobacteraceae bacterium]|nr:ATP synthase subunit I [Desulfobacteraceae bacterium]MBC2754566.1 ATP synthase subunit I [Desulfobacteraceae bacterium]MBC2763769.1 ATP synthase subunit I [ANME-2 cluster archaeon]